MERYTISLNASLARGCGKPSAAVRDPRRGAIHRDHAHCLETVILQRSTVEVRQFAAAPTAEHVH